MDITIRDTVDADLQELFRICTDPLVQPHQYKLAPNETVDTWRLQLFGDRDDQLLIKCTTILQHKKIIGHITHAHYETDGQQMCYCGWNITPECWGQGIAGIALAKLFDSFFGDQRIKTVISDCFRSNQRCIRVLQKLNYEPGVITLRDRVRILMAKGCLHWIRRFYLTADRWHATTQSK